MGAPRKDGVYRHFRGSLYVVLAIAIDAENDLGDDNALVVYRHTKSGQTYVRSVKSWVSKPKRDGVVLDTERFVEVE